MQDLEFAEIVGLICKEDPRFDRKAYDFVRQSLDHTVKEVKRKQPERTGKSQHVTGAELLTGIRDYALDQYGPLAKTVLNSWGVRKTEDFGRIVFAMVEAGWMRKQDDDTLTDFMDVFEFDEAFGTLKAGAGR